MNRLILLLAAFTLLCLPGFSQDTLKVPASVTKGFEKQFSNATDMKYEMVKKNYQVSFKTKEGERSALFTPTGRWMETRSAIQESDLPKKVVKSVNKKFKGYTRSDVARVETSGGKIYYTMIMKNVDQGYEIQVSPKGEILRKSLLKKEKESKPQSK